MQRTARVPVPGAPLRTGEPLAGPAELSLGMSSVGETRAPRLVDKGASLETSGDQFRGELRVRIRRAELTAIHERAVGEMKPLDPTQAPVEEGHPTGIGGGVRYSIDTGSPLSIGIGLELMSWTIPYVEYRTCVEWCEENNIGAINEMHSGTEDVFTGGFSITPTYRVGKLALFAGAYARRHPTIERKGEELEQGDGYEQDVAAGPYNVLVHVGAEYRLANLSLLATVQQDFSRTPVSYGPSFGFALAVRLPELPSGEPPKPKPDPWAPRDTRDAELPDDPW